MTDVKGWHPVGLSNAVEPGASAGTLLDGQELVVWRDQAGAPHVWEDRCPHRGMKLSFGFVRGDHIACLYHGWQYDAAGQCRYIPAHPDLEVPATIKVPVFAVAEQGGMIWTSLDAGSAPETLPVAVPVRTVTLDCNAAHAINLLSSTPDPSSHALPTVAELAENAHTITLGEFRLIVGVQRLAADRTALHVAVEASAVPYGASTLSHLALWAEQVRYRCENPERPAFNSRAEPFREPA